MIKNNILKILRTVRARQIKEQNKYLPQFYSQIFKPLYNLSVFSFASGKKHGDKKGQIKQEKQNIEKEYDGVDEEDLKHKYIEKAQAILKRMQDKFNEIQVMRQNPKILDAIPITNQGKRYKLAEVATITLRGANLLVVTPFDENMKDAINKGIEASKLDVQITLEGSSLVVTLGSIPNDLKKELQANINKIYHNIKESIKENRHSLLGEMKKLEKIMGKDDVKRLEKSVLDQVEK